MKKAIVKPEERLDSLPARIRAAVDEVAEMREAEARALAELVPPAALPIHRILRRA